MKKELITLTFLSSIFILVYFLFPNLQENIKKDDVKKLTEKSEIYGSHQKEKLSEDKVINLTFDIVRISKHGDAVLAGKSEPNIYIQLLDNDNEIANFFSDGNGEWIWVSDLPLTRGIKKFKLKHVKEDGKSFESDQTIVILNDKKTESKPVVAKFLDSSVKTIDMLNLDSIGNGLSLDLVNYDPLGSLSIKGRTLPNQVVSFLDSLKIVGKSISDENGKWKLTIKNLDLLNIKTIETVIKGQKISIPFSKINFDEYDKIKKLKFENKKIIVKPGNSLWRIARKNLGGGIFYSEIYRSNLKSIKNPDLIYPGQVFNMPSIKSKILYE